MTELKPEEREALIRALENGGKFASMGKPAWAARWGLAHVWEYNPLVYVLTPAGHLLAVELRKSDRLERAKGKLKEWETMPATTSHQQVSAHIALPASGGFVVFLTCQKYGADYRDCYTWAHDDPLTAAIEASKQTPWELEE